MTPSGRDELQICKGYGLEKALLHLPTNGRQRQNGDPGSDLNGAFDRLNIIEFVHVVHCDAMRLQ